MRLIDADELITFYFDNEEGEPTFSFVPKEFIDEAPTVEAIPIKWIKDYANELISLEEGNYFAYRGLGDYGKGLLELIEKWGERKEGDD